MEIVRKARGTEISKRAQRIFLCCDLRNLGDREKLIADVLSMDAGMDCLVSYVDAPGSDIVEELLLNELLESQVVILWVTKDLLSSLRNGDYPVEYRMAQEARTPVFPIAEYGEIFPAFTELAGAVHGIACSDSEYRTKLKAQLESYLVADETIRQIQENAFSAEVFLSYRKKDIHEARSFMQLFHDIEGFEAVSIWYDNFLTAGRIFDEEIRESIVKSDAFVLLVTPNLLAKNDFGKDNYVVSTEYPYALGIKKAVAAVEAAEVDPQLFAEYFPDIDNKVRVDDPDAMSKEFRDKLGESACSPELDSLGAYLLGMAYLKGFGVERDYDRAIRLFEKASNDNSAPYWLASEQLAELYQTGDRIAVDYSKALFWRKKMLEQCVLLFGINSQQAAAAHNNIAAMLLYIGDYTGALEWLEKALAIDEKTIGSEHPETAKVHGNIAAVYFSRGDYQKALSGHHKALSIYEKTLSEGHSDTAAAYVNLASTYKTMGIYGKALEYYQKALDVCEKTLGKEHPTTAKVCSGMATIYDDTGDCNKALTLYRQALAAMEKVYGADHPDMAVIYNNLAVLYTDREEYAESIEWSMKALSVNEQVHGSEHYNVAVVYSNIGTNYLYLKDYDKALESYHKALAIDEKVLGTAHPSTATTYSNIADLYGAQGKFHEALEWSEKVLLLDEKNLGAEHPDTAATCCNMGAIYFQMDDYQKAKELLVRSYKTYLRAFGEGHPDTRKTRAFLKLVYMADSGGEGDFEFWLSMTVNPLANLKSMLGALDGLGAAKATGAGTGKVTGAGAKAGAKSKPDSKPEKPGFFNRFRKRGK